jgi:hypothetical protein
MALIPLANHQCLVLDMNSPVVDGGSMSSHEQALMTATGITVITPGLPSYVSCHPQINEFVGGKGNFSKTLAKVNLSSTFGRLNQRQREEWIAFFGSSPGMNGFSNVF